MNGKNIRTDAPCDLCKERRKIGGKKAGYVLYAYNGKQICYNCARKVRLL